jgi:hypothetical protein
MVFDNPYDTSFRRTSITASNQIVTLQWQSTRGLRSLRRACPVKPLGEHLALRVAEGEDAQAEGVGPDREPVVHEIDRNFHHHRQSRWPGEIETDLAAARDQAAGDNHGRAGCRFRYPQGDFQPQNRRKPSRCQAIKVCVIKVCGCTST